MDHDVTGSDTETQLLEAILTLPKSPYRFGFEAYLDFVQHEISSAVNETVPEFQDPPKDPKPGKTCKRGSKEKALIDAAKLVRKNMSLNKADLWNVLKPIASHVSEDQGKHFEFLELVTRLVTMLNIRNDSHRDDTALPQPNQPQVQLAWPPSKSLEAIISEYFEFEAVRSREHGRFRRLNGFWLEKLGSFKIIWSHHLLDHLTIEHEAKVIRVFSQASVLKMMLNTKSPTYPKEFLEETLQSIALIAAPAESRSFKWLSRQQNLDPQVKSLRSAPLNISNYKVWRDRLMVLQEAFDECQPSTLSHWWWDDRNRVQWYTFWVAILVLALTLIFGAIQAASGVVQAYASMKALNTSPVPSRTST